MAAREGKLPQCDSHFHSLTAVGVVTLATHVSFQRTPGGNHNSFNTLGIMSTWESEVMTADDLDLEPIYGTKVAHENRGVVCCNIKSQRRQESAFRAGKNTPGTAPRRSLGLSVPLTLPLGQAQSYVRTSRWTIHPLIPNIPVSCSPNYADPRKRSRSRLALPVVICSQ
jgi:hypothetical protein